MTENDAVCAYSACKGNKIIVLFMEERRIALMNRSQLHFTSGLNEIDEGRAKFGVMCPNHNGYTCTMGLHCFRLHTEGGDRWY